MLLKKVPEHILKKYESKRGKRKGGGGGREQRGRERQVDADRVPLRAAVILCEGIPGSHAI